MCALAVIGATQIDSSMVPLTLATGGNSKNNPNAGNDAPHSPEDEFKRNPITGADRAGAGILTILIIGAMVGLSVWIVL